MDVIVIGGGASGMVSAITAARMGDNVTILEKNTIPGKKLLLTGNGRCNYYNNDMNISKFYSNGDLKRFIKEDNIEKVNTFFDSIGIIPRIKDGYYYPYSNTATTLQNSLLKELDELGVEILNEEVIDIKKPSNFIIKTVDSSFTCDKIILATGGITYSKTGSDGFGFVLLSRLGHHIIEPREALVPLRVSDNVKEWAGIRIQVTANYYIDDRYISSESGEAQLTEYGISGICIMNLSRFYNKNKKNKIKLDFIPTIDNVYKFMDERNEKLKNRTVIELLETVINYKLLYFIFKKLHLISLIRWDEMSDTDKKKLVNALKSYEVNIVGTKGIEFGETTTGGVSLGEINDNCESRIVSGLFIVGELLDIDGVCGGYNLTNAWITGILAGEARD